MSDWLRERMSAADPAGPSFDTDPVTSPMARSLLEEIMQTSVPSRTASRRRWAFAGGGLVAAGAATVGIVLAASGGGPGAAALQLDLPATDPVMSSCAMFDEAILASVPVAFAATVAEIADGTVTVEVDRWYKGGEADTVEIAVPEGFTAALDGVDFVDGERYLITAIDGAVTSCGLSGPATPEFEAIFERVFG